MSIAVIPAWPHKAESVVYSLLYPQSPEHAWNMPGTSSVVGSNVLNDGMNKEQSHVLSSSPLLPKPLSIPLSPWRSPPLFTWPRSLSSCTSAPTPPPVNQEASRRKLFLAMQTLLCSGGEGRGCLQLQPWGWLRETVFLLRGQRLPHILGQAGSLESGSKATSKDIHRGFYNEIKSSVQPVSLEHKSV